MQQIFDFKWKYNQSNNSYLNLLSLRNTDTNEVANITLKSYKFNFNLSQKKYCTGFFKNSEYVPCLSKESTGYAYELKGKNESMCFLCEQEQGFKAAFFYGQVPNENIKGHLEQKHFIYLAYFYPDIIKVGTAAESRQFIRPIEQDALLYAYVASSNGFEIQKLEHAIARELNIKLSVRSSQKLKFLDNTPNAGTAIKLLESNINSVFARFKDTDFSDNFFKRNQITITNLIPHLFFPDRNIDLIDVEEFSNGIPVVGNFKGLRGNYLLIENHDNILAFDYRSLIGRFVDYQEDFVYDIALRLF